MFLQRLREKNPALAIAAMRLHQAGELAANTYLIDLENIRSNAKFLRDAAASCGLSIYFMAKSFGRNPEACRAIVGAGLPRAVSVDLHCMHAHVRNGVAVGHVGHLMQPYRGSEDSVIAAEPEVVTVFTIEFARRLAAAAQRAGTTQPVLLRVTHPDDLFHFGQAGGFALDTITAAAQEIDALPGLRVAGVTTFPCMLGDLATRKVEVTHNFRTLVSAARQLSGAGFSVTQVNAPGTTSVLTLERQAQEGATHVEPGSALLGVTPSHLFDSAAPELPCIVYVSEVGHFAGDDAYVFASGGYYVDKVLGDYPVTAMCGHDESILDRVLPVVSAAGINPYYLVIPEAKPRGAEIGDTVVFCFRPQVFETRGRTQTVDGLGGGQPLLGSRYDHEGIPVLAV